MNGGGRDLAFPHHEFSAGHAAALTGHPLAGIYAHAGMVAYEGEKMSKSLGNLVLVSRLVADGADPRAIRLALLSERYRSDWEWKDAHLRIADGRLASWAAWAAAASKGTPEGDSAVGDGAVADGAVADCLPDDVGVHDTASNDTASNDAASDGAAPEDAVFLAQLRERLADDLDTPGAIAAIDAHIRGGAAATRVAIDALDALLGIRLAP